MSVSHFVGHLVEWTLMTYMKFFTGHFFTFWRKNPKWVVLKDPWRKHWQTFWLIVWAFVLVHIVVKLVVAFFEWWQSIVDWMNYVVWG